jgi:hypothetical protein
MAKPEPIPPVQLPPDLADFAGALSEMLSSTTAHPAVSTLFAYLLEAEFANLPRREQRRPKRPPDDRSTARVHLTTRSSPSRSKAGTLAIRGQSHTKPREKTYDRLGSRISSYRRLRVLFELESDPFSHFILNHKYKIVQFGCPSSFSTRVSDDEGATARITKPSRAIDQFNAKYDLLADEDILTEIEMRHHLRSPTQSANPEARALVIHNRCNFMDRVHAQRSVVERYPRTRDILFAARPPSETLDYTEFMAVLEIIANVETESRLLKNGNAIRRYLRSYRSAVRCAIRFAKLKHHVIVDSTGLMFIHVTHQLIAGLMETFRAYGGWPYEMFAAFLARFRFALLDIADDLSRELALQVDAGGWYSREFIRFRDLALSLDVAGYTEMFRMLLRTYEIQRRRPIEKRIEEIAAAHFQFGPLFAVRFVFTRAIGFKVYANETALPSRAPPVFPVFNVFGDGDDPVPPVLSEDEELW